MMGNYERKTKLFVAVGSFFAAVLLAFTSVLISQDHDVAGGVLTNGPLVHLQGLEPGTH